MMPLERYRHRFLVRTEMLRGTVGELRKLGLSFEIIQDRIDTLTSHGPILCLCRLVFNQGYFHQSMEAESSGKVVNLFHVSVIPSGQGRKMGARWNQPSLNKMIEKRLIEAPSQCQAAKGFEYPSLPYL